MTTRRLGTRTTLLALAALIALVAPRDARAQHRPHVQLLGGLTFLDTSDVVDGPSTGWLAGGAWNLTDKFGLEIQMSRLEQSQSVTFLDVTARFLTLLVGPTLTWRLGPVHPFGHVLVGTTQLDLGVTSEVPFPSSGDSQDTDVTLQLGGGVDVPFAQHFWARIAYDFRRVFAVEAYSQHGVSASAVYGFGGS